MFSANYKIHILSRARGLISVVPPPINIDIIPKLRQHPLRSTIVILYATFVVSGRQDFARIGAYEKIVGEKSLPRWPLHLLPLTSFHSFIRSQR
eukprot:scaffold4385_cov162-Skeletonema_menzelii.AAC.10